MASNPTTSFHSPFLILPTAPFGGWLPIEPESQGMGATASERAESCVKVLAFYLTFKAKPTSKLRPLKFQEKNKNKTKQIAH